MSTEVMNHSSQRKVEASTLFPLPEPPASESAVPAPTGRPRVKRADRQQAARRRAARERGERIRRALEELEDVESTKKAAEKDKARASTTDPEARTMKMGDGGFRPAHNVQFATDTEGQGITGADVVNTGSDQGQMSPMVEQHQDRYDKVPDEVLVDGGFAKHEDIEKVPQPGRSGGRAEGNGPRKERSCSLAGRPALRALLPTGIRLSHRL